MILRLLSIQTFIAVAYLRSRNRKPSEGEGHWRMQAAVDTTETLLVGPLTAWMPYAIYAGCFGSGYDAGAKAVGAFLFFCALAFALGLLLVRQNAWRSLVDAKSDWGSMLHYVPIMKVAALICFGTLNVALAWLVVAS